MTGGINRKEWMQEGLGLTPLRIPRTSWTYDRCHKNVRLGVLSIKEEHSLWMGQVGTSFSLYRFSVAVRYEAREGTLGVPH